MNLLQEVLKGIFNVLVRDGRGLNKHEPLLVGEHLGCLGGYLADMFTLLKEEVGFVAHEHDHNVRVGILLDLVKPCS